MIMALEETCSPCDISFTLTLTKSQLRNVLSKARLNNASSLTRFDSCNLILIAQMPLNFERCLLSDEFAFIPRAKRMNILMVFHDNSSMVEGVVSVHLYAISINESSHL